MNESERESRRERDKKYAVLMIFAIAIGLQLPWPLDLIQVAACGLMLGIKVWGPGQKIMNERDRRLATRRSIGRGWLQHFPALKLITCPGCGITLLENQWHSATRECEKNGSHFIDVGFKCPKCASEFGFEMHAPSLKHYEPSPAGELLAALDSRQTHDTASLKALGGIFYKLGSEEWCDTSTKSWRKEGTDLWVRR